MIEGGAGAGCCVHLSGYHDRNLCSAFCSFDVVVVVDVGGAAAWTAVARCGAISCCGCFLAGIASRLVTQSASQPGRQAVCQSSQSNSQLGKLPDPAERIQHPPAGAWLPATRCPQSAPRAFVIHTIECAGVESMKGGWLSPRSWCEMQHASCPAD